MEKRGVPFVYYDVLEDPDALEAMLRTTDGRRYVPVIVNNGEVTVGFGGT